MYLPTNKGKGGLFGAWLDRLREVCQFALDLTLKNLDGGRPQAPPEEQENNCVALGTWSFFAIPLKVIYIAVFLVFL
jgi:hypothetical protein